MTTSSVDAQTTTVPVPPPIPIPLPDIPPPPGLPPAGLACCAVVLRPGGDASFDSGGGLACLPNEAAGTTTATFRWVHAYESSGRFTLSVFARAGTCSESAGTGGLSGLIEVT